MAGVINKIRARVGLVIAIIGLAMAAFILNDVFSNVARLFGDEDRRNLAGMIGEQPVNAQAFSRMVQRRQQRNQLLGQEVPPDQLESQVWNEIVREEVLRAQFEPHGITVSDDEFYNMLFGDNPHPFARQLRQAGLQSPQQLQQYLNQLQQQVNQGNQQAQSQLIRFQNFERQMVQQRRMEKLNTYVSAGLIPTTAKARRNIMNRKRQASGKVLSVNYATIQDSTAANQLTEADYETYYEEHKARFEQDGPAAHVDYLAMPKRPSGRDSTAIRKKAFKYAKEFRTIQRDSAFAVQRTSFSIRNEQGPLFDFQWKPLEEFDLPTQRMIDTARPPKVFPPQLRGARYEITKLVGRTTADSLQRPNVRHILIPFAGNQKQDTLNAMNQAQTAWDSIANGGMAFEKAVSQFSQDRQTSRSGGKIGWLYPNRFGRDFFQRVMDVPAGEVSKPIESPAGYHVVKVDSKSEEVFRIAKTGLALEASETTIDSLEKRAGRFIAEFHKERNVKQAASKLGLSRYLRSSDNPLTPQTSSLPGVSTEGVRQVVRFALTNPEGKMADRPIAVENAIVVPFVRLKSEGDYLSLEMARNDIKPELIKQQKFEMIAQKLSGESLEAMRKAYGVGAVIAPVQNLSYDASQVPGIGNEPAVVGAMFGAPLNQPSPPVRGELGAYVVLVEARQAPAEPTEEEIAAEKDRLTQQLRSQMQRRAFQAAREAVDVKDFRYLQF